MYAWAGLACQPEVMEVKGVDVVTEEAADVEPTKEGELNNAVKVDLFRVDFVISVMQPVNLRV